jgi:uncharacterized protein
VAKEDRGFASMDRAKQREIASKGGKAAHQKGTAHEWTSEEARDAGRKGGIASHQRRREQAGGGSNVTPEVARERGSMDRSSGSGWENSGSSGSTSSERDSYGSERGGSTEPSMPIEENE